MRRCARRPGRGLRGRALCPCHFPPLQHPRRSARPSARHAGRRCMRRAGPCPPRAGRALRWPTRSDAGPAPCRAISGPQGCLAVNAAGPTAPVGSTRLNRLSWRAGMRAALRRGGACAPSNNAAPRAVRGLWPRRPAACAKRRASRLGHAAPRHLAGGSDMRGSAPQRRPGSAPSATRSRPRSPRRSTWPSILPPWSARGSRRRALRGGSVRPPGRWQPSDVSLPGCMRPTPPSQRASPCPGAAGQSRGLSTASHC